MNPGAEIWDPEVDDALLAELRARWETAGLTVTSGESLSAYTTFAIGGPAALMVSVEDRAELGAFMAAFTSPQEIAGVPVLVLGKGSNLLVSDAGFAGVVLKLGAGFKGYSRDGDIVTAGAAEAMPALAAWVAKEGLAGLEFAAGIPATVGGSVRMNAGAHGSSTAVPLLDVELICPGESQTRTIAAASLVFSYRHSELPAGAVVVGARWQLQPDDPAAVRARLDELRSYRRATQPLRDRNCGSVFTNPEGDSAGRLIEAAGLKGHTIGTAMVSPKHANFIAVEKGASAADVLALIAHIREVVLAAGGPLLVPEVRVVGHFGVAG